LVSAENALGEDGSSMEASLIGSSNSKCDACIATAAYNKPLPQKPRKKETKTFLSQFQIDATPANQKQ